MSPDRYEIVNDPKDMTLPCVIYDNTEHKVMSLDDIWEKLNYLHTQCALLETQVRECTCERDIEDDY